MEIHLKSYKNTSAIWEININWSIANRTRGNKPWEVLTILINDTNQIVKLIIAEEFKCTWSKKSLIISKKLQIQDWNSIIKELVWPKFYIISEISKKKKNPINKISYTNEELLEMYDFEYITDILNVINKITKEFENVEDFNYKKIYKKINFSFSQIIKYLNNIWCFDSISKQMLWFLYHFDSHENLEIEIVEKKLSFISLLFIDLLQIFTDVESELLYWNKIDANTEHIQWENEIDILIQKYIRIIEWSLKQTNYYIYLLLHPEESNNNECAEIEFF